MEQIQVGMENCRGIMGGRLAEARALATLGLPRCNTTIFKHILGSQPLPVLHTRLHITMLLIGLPTQIAPAPVIHGMIRMMIMYQTSE